MGSSMALNVRAAGHDLAVYDIRPETAEVVFTSLPGPREVEAVALGNDGLLGSMRSGAVWFDFTTNSPSLIRRLHEQFATRGLHLLDAPVSGGPKGARTRKLALWVGGDRAVFLQHKPILDAVGDQAVHVGPIGA